MSASNYLSMRSALLGTMLLVLTLLARSVAAADSPLTAREVFALLPESIFENTIEGLSESDKFELLQHGQTDFWEIAADTDDVLVLAALPFRETAVALRLFRHSTDGSIKAVIGTLGTPICTMELWQVDRTGRIVPADTPPEPDISDFFNGEKLPQDVNATVMLCLGMGGLKAQPVFWNSAGMTSVPVRNDVSYQWNGRAFEKHISPTAPASRPDQTPAAAPAGGTDAAVAPTAQGPDAASAPDPAAVQGLTVVAEPAETASPAPQTAATSTQSAAMPQARTEAVTRKQAITGHETAAPAAAGQGSAGQTATGQPISQQAISGQTSAGQTSAGQTAEQGATAVQPAPQAQPGTKADAAHNSHAATGSGDAGDSSALSSTPPAGNPAIKSTGRGTGPVKVTLTPEPANKATPVIPHPSAGPKTQAPQPE